MTARQPVTAARAWLAAVAAGLLVLEACWMDGPEEPADLYYARHEAEVFPDLKPETPAERLLRFDAKVRIVREHRTFALVATEDGHEGWVARSHLLDADTRDSLERLTWATSTLPGQGAARAWDTLNVHTEPYRWAPTFFQLDKDEGFMVLDRTLVDRLPETEGARPGSTVATDVDYWYLVRLRQIGQTGWLLENMAYADIPLDVAVLADGRAIVAHFQLRRRDPGPVDRAKPAWLFAQSSRMGQEHDFDVLRVFRWDARLGRYRLIRNETGLKGYLPVSVLDQAQDGSSAEVSFRVLTDRGGMLWQRSYVYDGSRVFPVADGPSQFPVPGGIGLRYAKDAVPGP